MGWERKRGKLEEFNRLLRGATDTGFIVKSGDLASGQMRFVLTLDADTVLPRDAARRLIATLAHPLNRPVLSADGRRVVAGYGVLQPRVSFLYRTGMRSRFARVFAGSAGIDPYSSASSDVFLGLFVLFVPNFAEQISKGLAGAVYGVILILVIYVMPTGAAGLVHLVVRRLASKRRHRSRLEQGAAP